MLVAWLSAPGCSNAPPPAPPTGPPSLSGLSVEIAAPPELRLAEQWSIQLDEWTAATGAACRISETETAADTLPESAALAVVPLARIPDLVDAARLAPIENPAALADCDDVLRGLRNGIARPAGAPTLIPVACPVLACYYRADLLEAAGRKPPETWEQYQALLDDLDAWSGGLPAFEPWSAEFRSTMFLARAASYALHPDNVAVLLDLQDASPLIAAAPFVQALEESRTALQSLDAQSLHMSPSDCCASVLEGRAALAIGLPPTAGPDAASRNDPAAVVGTVMLPGASRVYERSADSWSTLPDNAPSRVTVVGFGGFAACAPAAGDPVLRDAAWQLWTSLRRPGDDDRLPFGPDVCRSADVPAASRLTGPGFTVDEWRRHIAVTVAARQNTRVLLDLPLPQAPRFRQTLTARLNEALAGTSAPADALQQAAADWRGLIDELGRDRVLAAYRQCHGLAPH